MDIHKNLSNLSADDFEIWLRLGSPFWGAGRKPARPEYAPDVAWVARRFDKWASRKGLHGGDWKIIQRFEQEGY